MKKHILETTYEYLKIYRKPDYGYFEAGRERENAQLKKMYAEERLKAEIVQEALSKNGKAVFQEGGGP